MTLENLIAIHLRNFQIFCKKSYYRFQINIEIFCSCSISKASFLMVKSGKAKNLLGVITQYVALGFCRLGLLSEKRLPK